MFGGAAPPPPASNEARAWLARTHPDALLFEHHKRGHGLRREFKWLGRHRYATLNLGARDTAQLKAAYEGVCARFGWPGVF